MRMKSTEIFLTSKKKHPCFRQNWKKEYDKDGEKSVISIYV